jgi:Tfp pilus assembly protein PilV
MGRSYDHAGGPNQGLDLERQRMAVELNPVHFNMHSTRRHMWRTNPIILKVVQRRRVRNGRCLEDGLTFIELLMAMTLLTVGLSAIMGLIGVALASNNRNKKDTTAILLSQTVIELLGNVPATVDNRTITLTDCAGTAWTITTAPGGAPLVSGSTNIDWSSSYTTANYSMRYVTCGVAGQTATYDVRWNIARSGFLKTVVVAARQSGGSEKQSVLLFAAPVQIKTVFGI